MKFIAQKNRLFNYLNMLFPQITNGEQDRMELHLKDLEPIVAERKGDMIALYHFVDGEIHECPYIYIDINLEKRTAQTISYHLAEGQWYKNVNDYAGKGRKRVQSLLDEMTCDWLCEIIKKTITKKQKGR